MKPMTGEEACKQFMLYLNNYGCDEKGFLEEFARTHRTLQQKTFGLMFKLVKHQAEQYKQGNFDLRNEQAGKVCARIVDEMEDQLFMPFI